MNFNKKIQIRVLLLAPFLFFILYLLLYPLKEDKAKVIVRFDDYGVWCNGDWIEIEEEIIRLHEKYNVKLTYAVIPDSKYPLVRHTLSPLEYPQEMENYNNNPYPLTSGSRRVEVLKESTSKGITEIALHGFFHPKGYANTHKNSEFYNMPYDCQYEKLYSGKQILDSLFSTCVTTFIPPHNTYDLLTLNFLQELGFNSISAKQINFDAPKDERLNIKYLWFTTADFEVLKDVLRRKHYINEPTQVLALHHTNFTTDGTMDKRKVASYEQLLKYIAENNIPNYSFSNFPNEELNNNEVFYKVAYQNLLVRYGSTFASNFTNLCKFISPIVLMLLLILAYFLFIYNSVYLVISRLKITHSKLIGKIVIIIFVITLFCFVYSVFSAYSISVYSLYYILFSQKVLLQLTILSIVSPLFECKINRN